MNRQESDLAGKTCSPAESSGTLEESPWALLATAALVLLIVFGWLAAAT